MNTQNEIDWKFIQLRRTQWDENDDITEEHPLTYSSHKTLMSLLHELELYLKDHPPNQDIRRLKINDKTNGEISLQWYGPVFELDLDISADGKMDFLLCKPNSPREDWISVADGSIDQLIEALEKLHAFVQ